LIEVAPVTTSDARRALELAIPDVEDAFQIAAALAWQADRIVTRNVADFRRSPVRSVTPQAFLAEVGP
jgi:hypothetical protein